MSAKDNTSLKDVSIPNVGPSESPQQFRVMSEGDSLIADLVKEQPNEEQIARLTSTYRRTPDLLAFPEEVLAKHGKEYHFAWLAKGTDLAVKLRTTGWVLANRTNCPWIKAHRFGAHGAMEQAGMLLAFMPKRLADDMYSQPGKQSTAKLKYALEDRFKHQDKDAPYQFYKPEDKGED